jgi:hypothetical protein
MTPKQIIDSVRKTIQDNQLLRSTDEYIDDTLLEYVNQILKRTAVLRPDLFTLVKEISTTTGAVEQAMPYDSMRLTDIFSVKDGNAITEVSRVTMDRSYPGWTQVAAGTPVNWMRHSKNPNRYFLYPKPNDGVELVAEYVQSPFEYTLNEEIALLPDGYLPVIATGVIGMVVSAQGPNNDMAIANAYLERYTQMLGVSLQTKIVTDTELGGLKREQVI